MRNRQSKALSKLNPLNERRTSRVVHKRFKSLRIKEIGNIPNGKDQRKVASVIPNSISRITIKVNGVKYVVTNNHRDNNVVFMNSVSNIKKR